MLLIAVAVTLQNYFGGEKHFWDGTYTHYNNYIIFRQAFLHLWENKNLYAFHPGEHADFYKYSPTFAVWMAPFAFLPDFLGLLLWNVISCVVYIYAMRSIPGITLPKVNFIIFFALLEIVLSTQASQTNVLIAGLVVLAFTFFQCNRPGLAALLIVTATFIKLFAVCACLMIVFTRYRVKFIAYFGMWFVIMLALPLIAVSPQELVTQYENWAGLLARDHFQSYGMSVYAILAHFLSIDKLAVLSFGTLILLLPLGRFSLYANSGFRLSFLSALLIWMTIFNHKGESPAYVIAMTGCAIWFAFREKTAITVSLATVTWLLTSAIKSDIIPTALKSVVDLNAVCALMPATVFGVIVYHLLSMRAPHKEVQAT